MRDMVLVISYDATASRTVARKLRAERIFCKILSSQTLPGDVLSQEPMGVVLAGGAVGNLPEVNEAYTHFPLPLLALGDAAAGLCAKLGGKAGDVAIHGAVVPVTLSDDTLCAGVDSGERMLTCARTLELPHDFVPLSHAQGVTVGFRHKDEPLYGLQFQLEPNDPDSTQLLTNFASSICGCTQWWDNDAFIDRATQEIRRVTGEGRAICAVSGGVDSGVCAVLGHRAIGERMRCLYIDTGLMRAGESEEVVRFFSDQGLNISRIEAASRIMQALAGVRSGKEKETIINAILSDILSEESRKLPDTRVLIKGTNFSDLILSQPADAQPGSLTQTVIVEPLRELFKDEVRRVGEYLKLPLNFCQRQPFPGGGLALRIMGCVTSERLYILRRADEVFRQEIEAVGQEKRLWQYFALLTPIPEDDGVAVCLRAVHTSDGSDAHAARLAYDLLERATRKILDELPKVRRVVYDMTPSSQNSGIEWQ